MMSYLSAFTPQRPAVAGRVGGGETSHHGGLRDGAEAVDEEVTRHIHRGACEEEQ